MTSDSRSCKDSSSASFQNLRSTDHRPLLLPYLLSPACTLPRPPSSKYKRLCLTHRAPPIAGWLIESGSLTPRLRSVPLSGTSLLLRAVPPLSLRFRTLALVVLPLVASPFASESQVPTFRSTPSFPSSRHLPSHLPPPP